MLTVGGGVFDEGSFGGKLMGMAESRPSSEESGGSECCNFPQEF